MSLHIRASKNQVHTVPSPYQSEEDTRYDDELDDDWQDLAEDIHPSDSASTSNGHHHHPPALRDRAPARQGPRRPRPPYQQQPQYPQMQQMHQMHQHQHQHAPAAPGSADGSDEFPAFGHGYQSQGWQNAPRGAQAQQHNYQGGHVGPYMGYTGGQVMPYGGGYGGNPYSPLSPGSSGPAGYYGGDGRGMYDMMQYHHQHPGYYGHNQGHGPGPGGLYNLPAHMQQFQISAPVPPPTEHPASTSPAPPPKEPSPDPEKIRLEEELNRMRAKEKEKEEEARRRETEARIRKEAEDALNQKLLMMQEAQEKARVEIEKAKAEAQRAAREAMEAERKEQELREKAHAEALLRAEENARARLAAEHKEAEEKRQKAIEDQKRAEELALARFVAEQKKIEEEKAAAVKKAEEEAARLKQIQEDAKREAELAAKAAAEAEKQKAIDDAAAAEAAKAEHDAMKAKMEEDAKAAAAKAADEAKAAEASAEKAPIKFQDAVGRKFSFPFHICSTWEGMNGLIQEAFSSVPVVGAQVKANRFDLVGPNGEIILPGVWNKTIQPDWSIRMSMWPDDKSAPAPGLRPNLPFPPNMANMDPRLHRIPIPNMPGVRRMSGNPADAGRVRADLPGDWVRPEARMNPDIQVMKEPVKSNSKVKRNSVMLQFLGVKPTKKRPHRKS